MDLVAHQETLYRSKNPTRRWLHCARRDWIVQTLQELSRRCAGPALEIGPGSGVFLPTLCECFDRVVAADIERAYLDHAREVMSGYDNIAFVVDDITNTSLAEASFGVVLCTEVVEHIADSAAVFKAIKRLLRSGGLMVLSTPQRYCPLEIAARIAFLPGFIQIARRIYGESIEPTGHINLMTQREVAKQLADAEFTVVGTHKTGFYIPVFAELLKEPALALEQLCERKLRGTVLDGLLWTQYYVAAA